jgi:hypothetical protein
MTQTDNPIRAERCDGALARYGTGSPDENLIDLLTDAMHWCDTTPFNFHVFLAQACRHYVNELNGDQQDERRMDPISATQPLIPIGSESSAIDVHAVLAERRQVAVVWSIEDVQYVRSDLNDEQAWEVLQRCRHNHDCEYGFTWDYIKCVADDLFPPRKKSRKPQGGRHD